MKLHVVMAFLCLATGCAYHWGPQHRQLPGGHQKIYIPLFENRTQEVGVESEVTNAFIQELSRSGVGTVVSSKDQAEITLQGVIHTIDYLGKSSIFIQAPENQTRTLFTEYQTRVSIVLKVIDSSKKEIWQGQFLGEKNYKAPQVTVAGLSTVNPLYNQNARRQVLKAISKEMAAEATASMTENF